MASSSQVGIDLLRRAREEGGGQALRVSGAGLRRRLRDAAPGGTVAGSPPAQDFLAEPTVDRDPFEVVAESFLARFRAGERPSIEDLAARHPELADQIRELLPALVMVEQDLTIDHDPGSTARSPAGPSPGRWSGGWATTGSSARSAGAAWGSSTRPSRSAWAAGWR